MAPELLHLKAGSLGFVVLPYLLWVPLGFLGSSWHISFHFCFVLILVSL